MSECGCKDYGIIQHTCPKHALRKRPKGWTVKRAPRRRGASKAEGKK